MVASGELKAPIVIGRDHLDCGSVASPNRETEGMKDGSDAIADWPLLNALANTSCGADWVSIHNGGGVGIGNATHAGMVVVATGTKEKSDRLERVLTSDPALGIMRHFDAGYEKSRSGSGGKKGYLYRICNMKEEVDSLILSAEQLLTMEEGIGLIEDGAIAIADKKIVSVGKTDDIRSKYNADEVIHAYGKVVTPGLIDCHTHLLFAGSREHEYADRLGGKTYLEILESGGGILSTVEAVRSASRDELISDGASSEILEAIYPISQ